MAGASVQGVVATGRRRGCRVARMGQAKDPPAPFVRGLALAEVAGFNLHAGVRIAASDRAGLERLCRYLARPPLANDRLRALPDGRIALALRKPLRDGSTHLVFEPHELLEKLSAMVPAPWAHQTLFYGVFASASRLRPRIVPEPPDAAAPDATPDSLDAAPAFTPPPRDDRDDSPAARKSRIAWAALLARVFDIDALACPHCGGRMKVVALITKPDAVRAILTHLGFEADAPRAYPPRAPPDAGADD
ncbi:MAG: transposase [Myxococcota bacterium]